MNPEYSSPPPAELVKNRHGSYFIYGHIFSRHQSPLYAYIHTGSDGSSTPYCIVNDAIGYLSMKDGPDVEVVTVHYVEELLKEKGKLPKLEGDLPHFIHAKYEAARPSKGVHAPQMRNCVADGDGEKLKIFEKTLGIDGKEPKWYSTYADGTFFLNMTLPPNHPNSDIPSAPT